MAKIVFLPNDLVIQLDSPLTTAELVIAVQAGAWQPPPPFQAHTPDGQPAYHAVAMGRYVIVAEVQPGVAMPDPALFDPAEGYPLRMSAIQRQILQAMAEGLGDQAIAYRLERSVSTIRHHILGIKTLLGARNRSHMVSKGIMLGLVKMRRGKRG